MRFPSIPTFIRTFSLYNFTTLPSAAYKGIQSPFLRGATLRSMPTIPFIGSFFGLGQTRDMTDYPVKESDKYWESKLSEEQFRVVRQKGTEAPYSGVYDKHMPGQGVYVCLTLAL